MFIIAAQNVVYSQFPPAHNSHSINSNTNQFPPESFLWTKISFNFISLKIFGVYKKGGDWFGWESIGWKLCAGGNCEYTKKYLKINKFLLVGLEMI